jgi:protoporphyrinogen oxidase
VSVEEKDIIILGGGLCGLSAASVLGDRATVLERDDRPGGLVRTTSFNGYWFDHVLHLLYFSDLKTEDRIRHLLGDILAWCPPEAWVDTNDGIVRYPFQMHLGGLNQDVVIRCLSDLAKVTFNPLPQKPSNFEEMLLSTFGRGMCEAFLFPYNQKVWKRSLQTLAPSGFQWTITHPNFEQVLKGALLLEQEVSSYNAEGWYPRPPKDSPIRGMEVLSQALATQVSDLRLEHIVESIDLESRTVFTRHQGREVAFRYQDACCSTIPLPYLLTICRQTPHSLREASQKLVCNRVLTIAICIRGPRPEGRGHWRYYADSSLIFSRLVYMNAFDPNITPDDGWGLMAEITEPAEDRLHKTEAILERVCADIARAGALPADCQIVESHLLQVVDPAYVVFTVENGEVIEQARSFFLAQNVVPLGRYGRWEYSSMSQVLRDGFAWGENMNREVV